MQDVAAYTISELARRTGFSASSLRYYEQVGLMDPAQRSSAGYRIYDDDAVARLEFVDRAKRMGFTLEDIAELVGLWAGGECRPVQDRLRALLTEKQAALARQIVELNAFADQLADVRDRLDAHDTPDRCGDGCGCDVSIVVSPLDDRIRLTRRIDPLVPPVEEEAVIACTLAPRDVGARLDEWRNALSEATDTRIIDGGYRLCFDHLPDIAARLGALSVAETACCGFFRFSLVATADTLTLDIEAPSEARPLIQALIGTEGAG